MKKISTRPHLLAMCVVLIMTFSSCVAPLNDWTKPEFTDRGFQKIAVVGISNDLLARMEFEKSAVLRFKKMGINAVEGLTIFPAHMSEEAQTPENLLKLVQDNELDGVITMALVDTSESSRYQPGDDIIIGTGYRRFGNYYVRSYSRIHTPGYYVDTKSYLIEAVLYDLKGELYAGKETIVWTGQSSVVDPSSIKRAAGSFTVSMVNHMVKNGIVSAK